MTGLYTIFVYGLLYIRLAMTPAIFRGVYQETSKIAGLDCIAIGAGATRTSQTSAVCCTQN